MLYDSEFVQKYTFMGELLKSVALSLRSGLLLSVRHGNISVSELRAGKAPSSAWLLSCSLKRLALGLGGGVMDGCSEAGSSVSRKLANISCSLVRFGPEKRERERDID